MSHATSAKLALLGSLYFSQGLPFGFFTQALPVLLRKQGHSLESIGLASLLALPWALKFLWAPLVDRYGSERFGRRKSWIVPLQLVAVGVLAALASATEMPSLNVLFGAVFVLNLVAATQDIATDGLAVAMLARSERGLANGVQVAGYRVGMVAGGGALLILYEDLGQAGIFLSMSALTLLATLPIAAMREPSVVRSNEKAANVVHFVRRPGALRILGLLVVYKVGDAFATGMVRPFLADAGYTLTDIGWLLGTVGFVAGLLGALAGGALVNRLGRKQALLVFGWMQSLTIFGYAYVAAGQLSRAPIYAVCAAEHFASGMATAALFTCMMDWCSDEAGATDYTVQASAVVIATGAAGALSGFSAQHLGYSGHFALGAVLCLGSLLVVRRCFPAAAAAERVRRGTKEVLTCA